MGILLLLAAACVPLLFIIGTLWGGDDENHNDE